MHTIWLVVLLSRGLCPQKPLSAFLGGAVLSSDWVGRCGGCLKERTNAFSGYYFPRHLCRMSMSSNINIGIRHFLPAIPFSYCRRVLLERLLRVAPRPASRDHIRLRDFELDGCRSVAPLIPITSLHESTGVQSPALVYLSDSNVDGAMTERFGRLLHARGRDRSAWAALRRLTTLGNTALFIMRFF